MRLNGSVALHEVKLQIHLLNQFATAAKTTVCICKIYDPDLQFFCNLLTLIILQLQVVPLILS